MKQFRLHPGFQSTDEQNLCMCMAYPLSELSLGEAGCGQVTNTGIIIPTQASVCGILGFYSGMLQTTWKLSRDFVLDSDFSLLSDFMYPVFYITISLGKGLIT